MKKCTKCSVAQPLSSFYKRKDTVDGLEHRCKTCAKASAKLRRETSPEKIAAEKRAWELANAEKERVRKREQKRLRYSKMTKEERVAINRRDYESRDLAKVYARNVKRARKLDNSTFGSKDAIDYVYHAAKVIKDVYGTTWHVDHIVPLNGANVSGLHVASNLQLLSPEENVRKSNKWEIV